jgi:hypothetical protein
MNISDLLDLHHEARKIKEHWWYHHNEPDPPAMLGVRWRDSEPLYVDVASAAQMVTAIHHFAPDMPIVGVTIPPDEDPREPLIVYVILNALSDGVGVPGIPQPPHNSVPIEEITFNVEGYARKVAIPEGATEVVIPDVNPEVDYRTNPASEVRETMTTYWVLTGPLGTAEWGRISVEFHKGDGGRIEWDEPMVATSDDGADHVTYDSLLQIMVPVVTRENLV